MMVGEKRLWFKAKSVRQLLFGWMREGNNKEASPRLLLGVPAGCNRLLDQG